ncbi:Fc.00g044890.m01.CDS01 [Cosmosporella sp. VM-42]
MQSQSTQEIMSTKSGTSTGGARERKTQSCAECRRRRIRCDGHSTPCRQCIYYQVPQLCHYPTRKIRNAPSLKAYAELSDAYEAAQKVLKTLFPLSCIDELTTMTRDQLLALIDHEPDAEQFERRQASKIELQDNTGVLEPPLNQEFEWDETVEFRSTVSRVEDDVNGLSMSLDTSPRSYMGISSIPTILRVIVHTSAEVRQSIRQGHRRKEVSIPLADLRIQSTFPPQADEGALIDAYFQYVHPITPMIDEADFRLCRAQGGALGQNRGPWLALLNMVLVMGYIASNDASQTGHNVFYERASEHLDISCFGSGHLYTVQALGLFGGYYLHYLNRPNMASAVMGGALRMAVAIGLHRVSFNQNDSTQVSAGKRRTSETRIRTWWSLFCLDTWAGETLGRPSLRCWDPSSITTSAPPLRGALDFENMSLRARVEFCKIATRIQDRIARLPPVSPTDVHQFDEELRAWRSGLHPILQDSDAGSEPLQAARALLYYRLMTLRLVLYRPCLLNTTLKRIAGTEMSDEEKAIVDKCSLVALETVDFIAQRWFPNQISAWNGVWHIFQATVVLLLLLLSDPANPERYIWETSICKALGVLNDMRVWSAHAARSYDVIQLLYEARNSVHQDEGSDVSVPDYAFLDLLDMDMFDDDFQWQEFLELGTVMMEHDVSLTQ